MHGAVPTLEHTVDPVGVGVRHPSGLCSTWNSGQRYKNSPLHDNAFIPAAHKLCCGAKIIYL